MEPRTDVMISYQWDHQATAIAVKQSLESAGLTVWMDVERMNGNINDAMCEAVMGSTVVIPCLSVLYEKSHNCKKELNFADEERKPLVPIRLDKGPLKWSRLITAGSCYIDLSNIDTKSAIWDTKMKSLTSEIRSRIAQSAIETAEEQQQQPVAEKEEEGGEEEEEYGKDDLETRQQNTETLTRSLKASSKRSIKTTRRGADDTNAPDPYEYAEFIASFGSASKNISHIISGIGAACEKNIPKAFTIYAYCLEKGFGVPRDQRAAFNLYKRAVALNEPGAMNNLGLCYEKGIGTSVDFELACQHYKMAIEAGNVKGITNYARCLKNGLGTDPDTTQAFTLFNEAMEKGDPLAGLNVGISLLHGHGTSQDATQAVTLLKKYANTNAKAQNILGDCYLRGIGVPANPVKATDLYMSSSVRGNARAQNTLAFCYENGVGIEKDGEMAFRLYRKSAKRGDVMALMNVGTCYLNGIGTGRDDVAAFECFCEANEKGSVEATVKLATCYARGVGTVKDEGLAVEVLLEKVVKEVVKEALRKFVEERVVSVKRNPEIAKRIVETVPEFKEVVESVLESPYEDVIEDTVYSDDRFSEGGIVAHDISEDIEVEVGRDMPIETEAHNISSFSQLLASFTIPPSLDILRQEDTRTTLLDSFHHDLDIGEYVTLILRYFTDGVNDTTLQETLRYEIDAAEETLSDERKVLGIQALMGVLGVEATVVAGLPSDRGLVEVVDRGGVVTAAEVGESVRGSTAAVQRGSGRGSVTGAEVESVRGSVVADEFVEDGSVRGSVVADKGGEHGSVRGSVVAAEHASARGSVAADKPAEHGSVRGSVVADKGADKSAEHGSARGSVVAAEHASTRGSVAADKPAEHGSVRGSVVAAEHASARGSVVADKLLNTDL
ncbi:hypothetical protein BC829DRAFT_181199 [Chytridium lagenaria]|nr:hypothetical protein BC829DRAFT_181199 [Chytridium lagenaria]